MSLHEADRLLGVRYRTTAKLVAAGRLRGIPWGRRTRVLVADLERLAAEGLPDPTAPRRRPRPAPRKPAGDVVARILALDLDRRPP